MRLETHELNHKKLQREIMTTLLDLPFVSGDKVRIRTKNRDQEPLHHRTPLYIQGKIGWIDKLHGVFRDPSLLARHKPGLPKLRLYRIGFAQHDLWGSSVQDDILLVDVYEDWIERA